MIEELYHNILLLRGLVHASGKDLFCVDLKKKK